MLNKLTKALEQGVKQIGGIDAAMAACDRMYSATFRSEAFKLSDLDDAGDFKSELYFEVAVALYSKATGEKAPVRHEVSCGCEYDCDCSLDSWGYAVEAFEDQAESWFSRHYPDFEITGDTLVVDFCNYKGEGEGGVSIYELNKHLPVFKSKNESFHQVN